MRAHTNFFRLSNNELLSVSCCDLEYVKEIKVTFYRRRKANGEPVSKTIPYTKASHKQVMDTILKFGGTVDGILRV